MQTEKVIEHIVGWLDHYCEKSKLNGFAVGISGGIDSAVTSTLCARTGKPTCLLNMPIHQDPMQVSLSKKHIDGLVQQYPAAYGRTIELTSVFQSFSDVLPGEIQDDLTMANTRSRIRMVTLYAFAGHHRYLVAGTGNKVEDFGVGFFTKYGDGGVDVSPIADLLKSEVYQIGRSLGIIAEILQAPPTDGLWHDNRTDESQIGASYAELEWAMKVIESSGDESRFNDRQKEVISIFKKFNNANHHKMKPVPICRIPPHLK